MPRAGPAFRADLNDEEALGGPEGAELEKARRERAKGEPPGARPA